MSTNRELTHLRRTRARGVGVSVLVLLGTGLACHEVTTSTSSPPEVPKIATSATSAAAGADAANALVQTSPWDADATTSGADDAGDAKSENPKEPLYLGRFVTTDKGHGCGWSGCEVRLRFHGTGVRARMDTGWANRFRVHVDGDRFPETRIVGKSGEDDYVLARDLPEGDHELSLVRITEAGFGEWHIRGFTVDGGELLARPEAPLRRIEFIGDSITCGAGNTGTSAQCPLDQNTEDSSLGYAGLAAAQLHASYTNICYSGRGVYRDAKGFTSHPMTLLWRRTFVQRRTLPFAHETLVPDAVVVNLGTNDTALSYERERYLSAQANFYKTLRKTYPQAHLVYVVGARKTTANVQQAARDLAQWVTSLGPDGHASFLQLMPTTVPSDEREDCAFHPGLKSHARMADAVVAHLREKLHWDELRDN